MCLFGLSKSNFLMMMYSLVDSSVGDSFEDTDGKGMAAGVSEMKKKKTMHSKTMVLKENTFEGGTLE